MTLSAEDGIRSSRLDNGITLVFEPMPWLRSLSMAFLLPVGSVSDPEGADGSATVLYDWLGRGAGDLDSKSFSDALDSLGIRSGGGAGRETMSISTAMLASAMPKAIPLFADMLRRPRLEDAEFEPARELAQQELMSIDDNPAQKLGVELKARFFTSAHRRSSYGTAQGLAGLTPDSVRRDYRLRVAPNGMIIAAAGGAAWEELESLVREAFGDWSGKGAGLPEVAVAKPGNHHFEADTSQVQIGVAYPAVKPTDPNWYHQTIAYSVLSAGFGSRLFTEVREKRGLVYSVHANPGAVRGYGYVTAHAGTTPERAEETLAVLLAEIERLGRGIDEDEFARARTRILAQLVMQGESSGARASALAHDLHLRGAPRSLPQVRAEIEKVTLTSLNDFLARQEPPKPVVVTLGRKAAAV